MAQTCTQSNYFDGQVCSPCGGNCGSCTAPKVCTSCNSGYSLAGQNCVSAEEGSGSIIPIAVGAGVGALLLLAGLIFCCYRYHKAEEVKTAGAVPVSSMDSNNRLGNVEETAASVQSFWRPREVLGTTINQCRICRTPTTLFMTSCGHIFHAECLVKWSSSHQGCPTCHQSLNKADHVLFCRECTNQEQLVSLQRLEEIVRGKKMTEETICSNCFSKE
jgi:hypothetical protein